MGLLLKNSDHISLCCTSHNAEFGAFGISLLGDCKPPLLEARAQSKWSSWVHTALLITQAAPCRQGWEPFTTQNSPEVK